MLILFSGIFLIFSGCSKFKSPKYSKFGKGKSSSITSLFNSFIRRSCAANTNVFSPSMYSLIGLSIEGIVRALGLRSANDFRILGVI